MPKAWIKGQWRYITDMRLIEKGRKKGCYEVTLPNGKKKIVFQDAIRGDDENGKQ